jgi:hypothetical protein
VLFQHPQAVRRYHLDCKELIAMRAESTDYRPSSYLDQRLRHRRSSHAANADTEEEAPRHAPDAGDFVVAFERLLAARTDQVSRLRSE